MRKILNEEKIDSVAVQALENFHRNIVDEVSKAVENHEVVVVGMSQNPFVSKAKKFLEGQNKNFTYLEYGNYFSKWQERLAIKLWSGWPTFPQVFVKGKLIGGYNDLVKFWDKTKH